jgi:hypothetical protein
MEVLGVMEASTQISMANLGGWVMWGKVSISEGSSWGGDALSHEGKAEFTMEIPGSYMC